MDPRRQIRSHELSGPDIFTRIKALLDATKGEVALGGETDSATNYIAPTVVRDVREGDSLLSESVSHPLLVKAIADVFWVENCSRRSCRWCQWKT